MSNALVTGRQGHGLAHNQLVMTSDARKGEFDGCYGLRNDPDNTVEACFMVATHVSSAESQRDMVVTSLFGRRLALARPSTSALFTTWRIGLARFAGPWRPRDRP